LAKQHVNIKNIYSGTTLGFQPIGINNISRL